MEGKSLHAEANWRARTEFFSNNGPVVPNSKNEKLSNGKGSDETDDNGRDEDNGTLDETEKFLPSYSSKDEIEFVPRNGVLPEVTNGMDARKKYLLGEVESQDESWKRERYGWNDGCSPNALQCLVNKKAFLIVFCITCVLQGTFHTYFVAVITTLEKLFSIPSRTTGTLMMATEIGQVSSSLLLPYFAGGGHRPRFMGVGASLFALAALLCSSPHILFPPKLDLNPETSTQYCTLNSTDICLTQDEFGVETFEGKPDSSLLVFAIIFASLLVLGLGQTAVYTLGIPYLDDNVASRDSPLYFSITIGVRILGPVTGFILGSLTTRLYIYPFSDQYPDYGPSDPRWLGAWWLGMVLISVLLFLASLVMFGFPARLSKVKASTIASVAPRPHIRDFPVAIKRLLRNRILVLRTFSSVFHLLPISGLYTFLPKYLESQFRLAAHEANMVAGIAGILVMGIGIFGSGMWIRRREPSARNVAAWVAVSAFCYSCGMFLLMFIGCEADDFNVPGSLKYPNCATDGCSNCSSTLYSPVCGSDKQVYFSPCHAGCSQTSDNGTFTDCECVAEATSGLCSIGCELFPVYLAIFMAVVLIHSTSEVGSMLLTLRCVEPRDKAMALGLIQCAIGIFGNVPCPVIYGSVVDRACVIWGSDCNDAKGHCWVYDSTRFRTYFHGLTGGLMMIAFVIDVIVFFQAKSISLGEEKDKLPDGAASGKQFEEDKPQMKMIES